MKPDIDRTSLLTTWPCGEYANPLHTSQREYAPELAGHQTSVDHWRRSFRWGGNYAMMRMLLLWHE